MRIVLGITGASGAIYGIRILEALKRCGVEVHLVISKWAEKTIPSETGDNVERLRDLADHWYRVDDLSARISSGSFKTSGMIVAPCSMKTVAAISSGYSDNLISRAADVTIKEGRKLVLVVRETPLSPIHLRNMLALSRIGVTIMPPVPAFYNSPRTIDDLVKNFCGRVLDCFGIQHNLCGRWDG